MMSTRCRSGASYLGSADVVVQERLTTASGKRDRAEAELALAHSALAACKRRLSSACAENVLLVTALGQTMEEHAELTCTAPPD